MCVLQRRNKPVCMSVTASTEVRTASHRRKEVLRIANCGARCWRDENKNAYMAEPQTNKPRNANAVYQAERERRCTWPQNGNGMRSGVRYGHNKQAGNDGSKCGTAGSIEMREAGRETGRKIGGASQTRTAQCAVVLAMQPTCTNHFNRV